MNVLNQNIHFYLKFVVAITLISLTVVKINSLNLSIFNFSSQKLSRKKILNLALQECFHNRLSDVGNKESPFEYFYLSKLREINISDDLSDSLSEIIVSMKRCNAYERGKGVWGRKAKKPGNVKSELKELSKKIESL